MVASHSTEPADIVGALRRGVYDYFAHPLDFDALASRIRTALQRRRAGEEAKRQLRLLGLIRDVTAKLTASLNAREILEGIAKEIHKRIPFDAAIIRRAHEAGEPEGERLASLTGRRPHEQAPPDTRSDATHRKQPAVATNLRSSWKLGFLLRLRLTGNLHLLRIGEDSASVKC